MVILVLENLMLLLYRIELEIITEVDLNKHPLDCRLKLNQHHLKGGRIQSRFPRVRRDCCSSGVKGSFNVIGSLNLRISSRSSGGSNKSAKYHSLSNFLSSCFLIISHLSNEVFSSISGILVTSGFCKYTKCPEY